MCFKELEEVGLKSSPYLVGMPIFQGPRTESLAIIGEIGGDIQKYHHPVPGWEKQLKLYPWQINEVEEEVERSPLQIPRNMYALL